MLLRIAAATVLALGAMSAALWAALSYLPAAPAVDDCVAPVSGNFQEPRMIQAKIADSKSGKVEQATFGAGCFWGVEATFRATPGVLSTWVGFAGGRTENPTYEDVCYTNTNHAEVVHLEFDPEEISYRKLVDIFFANHNPTTLNRQGPDVGSQYRSVVFYHGDSQKTVAEEAKRQLGESGKWGDRPIVTQVAPFTKFYPAEEYHQQYLEKRGKTHCH